LIKRFLDKYGRHFWVICLIVTVLSLYQFIKLDGDLFFVLMFGALTYYFYLKGTGKLKDEDDPFVE
tara:strand:- start:1194 stop:1391 length:198 start_codon:yes stop_codon:yes gene_type:complete